MMGRMGSGWFGLCEEGLPEEDGCARLGSMEMPVTIVCVDCGQPAHRLTLEPEDGWETGDYVAYRCSGCNDRWDLIVTDEDEGPAESPFAAEARALLAERRGDRSQGA